MSLSNCDGTYAPARLTIPLYFNSEPYNEWTRENPRYVVDTNGDGIPDVVGFRNDGVYTAIGKGDGTFQQPKRILQAFGYNQGWRVDKHPRFLADLTGNGYADIIVFGDSYVYVAYNDGMGVFASPKVLTTEFADNQGKWSMNNTVRYVVNVYG